MSQSPHPTDSQAVLQSMLQRLKLQSGREGQMLFQTPVSPSAAPALGQIGERGAPSLQEVDGSPVSVFSFNGNPAKENPISATNFNPGFKSDEKQQASSALEGSRSPTLFPLQNFSLNGNSGEKRDVGRPGFSSTGSHPLFPAKPQKEIKLTFFKKTDADRGTIGSPSMKGQTPANTDTGPDTTPDRSHVPVWSVNSTDPDSTGTGFHVGNGGISSLEQNKELQVFSSSQITATSTRRKRSTENKTRRWTQKIKERFKDRHGNAGKKGKEDGPNEHEAQVIMPETPGNTPSNDAEETFSLDCTDSNKLHPAQTEDNTTVSNNSDFDFGLGSFSLLEEIVKGQEWARFINPKLSTTSVIERPTEVPSGQPHIQQIPCSPNQSPGTVNQVGTGSNQWSLRSTASTPGPVFNTSQLAPAFPSVSMDTSALNQQADQSEPMEDGQSRSEMLSKLQLRLSAFAEPSSNPYHSITRSTMQMSRKRTHQLAERSKQRLQSDGEKTDKGLKSSPSSTGVQMMEESVEPQQENVSSLPEPRFHPAPLSPTSANPSAPLRGVLRHSLSHDNESSMETLTKRRRVEAKRQVHFCEQVITIDSPDMDETVSDEDLEADEDSLFEPDFEAVQEEMDEALPARRSNLPAWIQALKKMNAGKKHR